MDAKPKKKRKLVLVACPLVGLVVSGVTAVYLNTSSDLNKGRPRQ